MLIIYIDQLNVISFVKIALSLVFYYEFFYGLLGNLPSDTLHKDFLKNSQYNKVERHIY